MSIIKKKIMEINTINLVGRAGREPDVRYFESGSIVANFTLAVNRRSRDEEPDWFNLEIWGKQAQIAADYVKKGSLIGITGSFKIDSWKDKNTGEDRYKPVVRVDRLNLLGSRKESDNYQPSNSNNSSEIPFYDLFFFNNLIRNFIRKYKKIKIKIGLTKYLI